MICNNVWYGSNGRVTNQRIIWKDGCKGKKENYAEKDVEVGSMWRDNWMVAIYNKFEPHLEA